MEKDAFEELFEEEFIKPLLGEGFQHIGRGQSLRYVEGTRELLILRQGGKLLRPGMIRHSFCFRHRFLRPINSENPGEALNTMDCPRKLALEDFGGWFRKGPDYRPLNNGRWPIHNLVFADKSTAAVRKEVVQVCRTVVKRVLPWVRSLTEAGELAQIRANGEDAWCERRWIEDYERFLAEMTSQDL